LPDRRPCWDVSSGGSRWPRSGKRCWVTTTLWGNSGSGGPQRPPEPSGPPRRTHTHASRWADERARSQSRRPFPPPGAGAPLRHCPPPIGVGAALGYRTCLTHRFRPRRCGQWRAAKCRAASVPRRASGPRRRRSRRRCTRHAEGSDPFLDRCPVGMARAVREHVDGVLNFAPATVSHDTLASGGNGVAQGSLKSSRKRSVTK